MRCPCCKTVLDCVEIPSWELPPKPTRLIEILLAARGAYVTIDNIIQLLYNLDEPENPENVIAQMVFKIRKRFGRECIVSAWGKGYRWSGKTSAGD